MSTGSVQDMEVHTQNLSHSSMPGYKRLESSHASFADAMQRQSGAQDTGKSLSVNYLQGGLRSTERAFDFAIEGKGFFVVSDGNQEFLTRNGSFRVSADGTVVNSLGMAVQTSAGDLRIPPGSQGPLELDDALMLKVGAKTLGQLRLISVEDTSMLEQAGTTLFVNQGAAEVEPESKVLQGFLEQSNTSVFEEMVGIMTTLRNYEACQKMLKTVDEADEKMMSKLA